MIENIRVKSNAAFPSDRRGLGIDAHFLELAHVAPELERADLEQVAEEHAPFQAVLEAQPQLVIVLGLAGGDPHLVPFLFHVAVYPLIPSSGRRRSGTRSP